MPSFRGLIETGSDLLARRLDELCGNLESLSVRLRGTIANTVGETIGGIVRDAALSVIDAFTGCLSRRSERRPAPRHDYASDPRDYETEGAYWADEDWESEVGEEFEAQPSPTVRRMPTAVSAGLLAAAFWLRRAGHVHSLATTCTIGLIATAVAYFGGPVAVALVDLATSAGLVPSLSAAVSSRSMFGWLRPA